MTTPSTGTFSPGRTRSRSPTCTCVERDVLVACRRRASRRAVFGARPSSALIAAEVLERALQLEQLAEQRQRHDDRGRLEVDADAAVLAERVREQLRRDGRDHAVAEGRADAECRSASTCWGCGSRSTAPSARRRATRPTARPAPRAPARPSVRVAVGNGDDAVAEHRQPQHDERQRQRPPEAPAEIAQLRVLVVVEGRHHRLERHAADRAMPGASRTISGCIGQVYLVPAGAGVLGVILRVWAIAEGQVTAAARKEPGAGD